MSQLMKIEPQTVSLAPKNMDEAMAFAKMIASSDMVPKDYRDKPANCLVAIQWGYEIGLAPMQALQNIAVINGRPAVYGDSMLALVKGSGLLESMSETMHEGVATCMVKRRGEPETVRTFSIEQAKKANLWGKSGPWQQYPERMLQMRARAFALRDVFPDVLKGMYVAEEAQDIPPDDAPQQRRPQQRRPEQIQDAEIVEQTPFAVPDTADIPVGRVLADEDQKAIIEDFAKQLSMGGRSVDAMIKREFGQDANWKNLTTDQADELAEKMSILLSEIEEAQDIRA